MSPSDNPWTWRGRDMECVVEGVRFEFLEVPSRSIDPRFFPQNTKHLIMRRRLQSFPGWRGRINRVSKESDEMKARLP